MNHLQWRRFEGQERIKDALGAAYEKETLGHAYLFHGDPGTGKFVAGLEIAMALLCTGDSEARPCYGCEACRKVLNYAHPDFHVIMPLCFEKEHKSDNHLTEKGWEFLSGMVIKRIKDPYLPQRHDSIPQVPVDWVREVNHAIHRGALEGGKNVVILDGIDMMNKESSNALLKTLEEPPEGTLMLALTERIQAVLPTIVSRCQIMRFGYVAPEIIREALTRRLGAAADAPRVDGVVDAGSIGMALAMYENPLEDLTREAAVFWNACVGGEWETLTDAIDRLSKIGEYGTYERFFLELMYLLRNATLTEMAGGEMKYFMRTTTQSIRFGGPCTPGQVHSLMSLCQDAIAAVRVRAVIGLVLANFALSAMEKLHGEK